MVVKPRKLQKPPEVDELPTIIYGSSKMHVNLEDDKEYLICGKLGALKPDDYRPFSSQTDL